jgi:anti-sigma regulatory factor (Ser/Thr protein kinase)
VWDRHTLGSWIKSNVEQHDVDVTVNVIDLGCSAAQNALANAVGEAITNAIQHALANTIVVFAETNDGSNVFASVRDDGMGFDTARVEPGVGLDRSVRRRMLGVVGRTYEEISIDLTVSTDSAPDRRVADEESHDLVRGVDRTNHCSVGPLPRQLAK